MASMLFVRVDLLAAYQLFPVAFRQLIKKHAFVGDEIFIRHIN
jgi:hypothetical protein